MKKYGELAQLMQEKILRYLYYLIHIINKYIPNFKEGFSLLSLYFTVVGLANLLINKWLLQIGKEIAFDWAPYGLISTKTSYNISFIQYIFIIFSISGAFVLKWILEYLPSLRLIFINYIEKYRLFLLVITFGVLFYSPLTLSALYCATALLLLFLSVLPFILQKNSIETLISFPVFLKKNFLLFLGLPILLSLIFVVKAWYPVQIPNDYFELPDSVIIKKSRTETLQLASRASVIDCLEANSALLKKGQPDEFLAKAIFTLTGFYSNIDKIPNEQALKTTLSKLLGTPISSLHPCALDISTSELEKLRRPILKTGWWEVQAGRLLYHHSYLVVPALHILKYGIMSPIPYLYGFGNTLFHSMLLRVTSPTLTSYFNTFPIAQFVGVIILLLLALYLTRSYFAVCASVALMLITLSFLGFENILLPPGFSPLRGAGLAVQVASIFCLFRGTSVFRYTGVLLALAFSLFWNKEFAFIGVVGQGLALVSPQIKFSVNRRFIYLACMGIILAIFILFNAYLERGFSYSMGLSLFGGFPNLSRPHFLLFCLFIITSIAVLTTLAIQFKDGERIARFCILPVMALMMTKYLYYSVMGHFYFILILIIPMVISYFKWQPGLFGKSALKYQYSVKLLFIVSLLVFLGLLKSISYYSDSLNFRALMVQPFKKYEWSELGESFITTTPAKPIVSRIDAIRSQIQPDDFVLFLSPFDHLMSIYVNPEHYCGHFDLLTNLVTNKLIQSAINCIKHSSKALIVFDDANETLLPLYPQSKYYDPPSYNAKMMLKQNYKTILNTLGSGFVLVKKIGQLSFYRSAEYKNDNTSP